MNPSEPISQGFSFDPIVPMGVVIIIALILAGGTVALYRTLGTRLSTGQNITLTLVRVLGIIAVLLILLQPSRVEEIPPPAVNRVTLVAVDASRSMEQRDVEEGTRLAAAMAMLREAELVTGDGKPVDHELRMFSFADGATVVNEIESIEAEGTTTRLHRSLTEIIGTLKGNESARALILLSDGHDFELVNPAKTGFLTRTRGTPIYAVPIGKSGRVRDVSTRITSYQPYCYVKQKARISAAVRMIGVELEVITVDLLRAGTVVETKQIQSGEDPELPVNFEVMEPEVGQFEYEVRARTLNNESDPDNNSAITYLNVIDQQIQVLMLEGSPYWDTTFLQRSLMRNDKINVDSIVQYAKGKARVIRKKASETELQVPTSVDDWRRYDVVVLGRAIDELLSPAQINTLTEFVRDHGGTVAFSRGPAFGADGDANELEPVIWSDAPAERVRLQPAREGQTLAPFRVLAEQNGGLDEIPDLVAGRAVLEKKPLAATLANAQAADGSEAVPGMVHRRLGSGQVLSVGVDGLWRWAFNAKVDGPNTIFDRFWDQMVLWLMAGRDFLPTEQFSLRASSANIPLGEKIYFRGLMRDPKPGLNNIPLVIEQGDAEIARTALQAGDPQSPEKLSAEFLAAKPGRYSATAHFPDGTKQTARFMVFDENLEQTEVTTDPGYLRRLCETSGGRLIERGEIRKVLDELRSETTESTPMIRLVTLWDRAWVFWMIGLLFGVDWFLRRRWGLC